MTTIFLILIAIVAVLVYLGFIYRAPNMSQFDLPEHDTIIADHEVSDQHEEVLATLTDYHSQRKTTDITVGRRRFEELFARDIDVETHPVEVDSMKAEWVLAEGADPNKRLLYIHGGAFMVGSPRTHRYITSELSRRTGTSVLAIDYRKQPEFKTIHCHEDARKAYRWILENGPGGVGPVESLFVAGDSAGGNLTLAVIAWARDNNLKPADGAIALAPLTDATLSSPTWRENLETDHFLGPGLGRVLKIPTPVRHIMSRLSGGLPGNHPHLSPLFGSLHDLPPTLIQVSRHEMLYGDAKRYANKANHEGSAVILQVWPKLVHVFQGFGNLPETNHAFNLMAEFVAARLRTSEKIAAASS
ncbi:MAG: alpha/beta hydrolase [Gammaproteobacteria bacterium]|nr:alpha/beta hydrolase [Gammaproteobacteria bacterium]MBT4492705.1 alpha/beta hydrolase [Gammaproteobacteria bacterium]